MDQTKDETKEKVTQMKQFWQRGAGIFLVLLLLVGAGLGAAQAAEPVGAQGVVEEALPSQDAGAQDQPILMNIGSHSFALPDGWDVTWLKKGQPQFQFVEPDGSRGICMVMHKRLTAHDPGLDANGILNEICKAFGSQIAVVQPVGNRSVAVFDAVQGQGKGQIITNAIFMEGTDILVVQVHILDSTDTIRQQQIALQVVKSIDAEELQRDQK